MNAPGWLTLAAVVIATAAIGFAARRAVRGGLPAFQAALFAVVAADLVVIALAVASAQQLGYWNPDGALWAKTVVVAAVTLLVLYLADLYKLDFRIRWLFVALAAGATATAAIGFALPVLRLGRLAFLHILGVVALGLLTSRLVWIALGPKRQRRS